MQSSQCYRFATRPYFPFSLIKVDVALQIRLGYRGRCGKRVSKIFIFVVKMVENRVKELKKMEDWKLSGIYVSSMFIVPSQESVGSENWISLNSVSLHQFSQETPPKKKQAVINAAFKHFHIYLCLQFYFFIFLDIIQSILGQKTELY